jgi:hypothetical protein
VGFLFEKENGHITGNLPKLKEILTEKLCNGCKAILPIVEFSKGKGTCKKCRAKICKEKYRLSSLNI